MKIDTKSYLAASGQKFNLKDFSTSAPANFNKDEAKTELEKIKLELANYQKILYAANSRSVLIIFQAMDAAGKDSAIEHVMSGLNPQGCQVFSFKAPTSEEYDHDFLWRHYRALPERGRIGIHNRSHYENVLVCKVHPAYVLNENLPHYNNIDKIGQKFWNDRYESIRNFERHLTANGTIILKFFLHVSKEEQKERFLERIEDPAKNWKFAIGDIKERALWKQYMVAYQEAIQETSTTNAPWYVIPADSKAYARLLISKIIEESFEALDLKFSTLLAAEIAKLADIKQQLLDEKK